MYGDKISNSIQYTLWISEHQDHKHAVQAIRNLHSQGGYNVYQSQFDPKAAFEIILDLLLEMANE